MAVRTGVRGQTRRKLLMEPRKLDAIKQVILAQQEDELTLDALSAWAGVSRFHLQREFKKHVGESPTKYLERVRLQKAANSLLMKVDSVLDVALSHGYNHHESFTRAFRRQYQLSPRDYRASGTLLSTGFPPKRDDEAQSYGSWQISKTRVQRTKDLHLKTHRLLGAYEQVGSEHWQVLQYECDEQGIAHGALVGLGWDNPATTPEVEHRFDVGLLIAQIESADLILSARMWAVTLYTGSFANLSNAYSQIAVQVAGLRGMDFDEGPILEVYHADSLVDEDLTRYLEVFMPIRQHVESVISTVEN